MKKSSFIKIAATTALSFSLIQAGLLAPDAQAETTTTQRDTVVGWASTNLRSMSAEEAAFGVDNGMLSTYVDFVNAPQFPAAFAIEAKTRDAALLIAWEPYDWNNPALDQKKFKPKRIAAGAFDAYLIAWLKDAQQYAANQSVLVRFAPEMNDAIRPWSVGVNGGNTAADYVAMFRHVYELKEQWAPDVALMWNPLVAGATPSGTQVSLESVFPGSNYVDVLALDGFNWADVQNPAINCNWQSYADVFDAPVAMIKTLAQGKPWGIAEVASASRDRSFFETGGECEQAWGSWVFQWPESYPYYQSSDDWITQAGWMKTLMLQAHDDGALFVNMFNIDKETDWRLNSSEAGTDVLRILDQTENFAFGGDGASGLIDQALN